MALSSSSIGEKGGTSTVTATVSPASATPFTVTVATDPATPSDDFTVTPNKTLSFAADATTSTGIVTITAVNDDVDAADQTVTVSGTASINTVTAPSDLTLTITDDDVPAFTIEDASGSEGGMVVFPVRMSVASTKAMTVNYATSDIVGQAVAGTDYTARNGTLTFAAGETLQTISVTTADDTVDDPVETFTMTLSSPSADATGDPAVLTTASATGTISEGATLSIEDASIVEGAKMRFTVTLSEAPTGSDRVTVRYATSTEADDTAEMTDDYNRTSGTLGFFSGQSETNFLVRTVNDGVDEEDETFTVTLSSPSAGVTIITATATGTITDDDEVPGAPTNLAAEAGDAQVVLTWAAPDSAGTSTITGYEYSYAPSGEAFSAWASVGMALTATVTGLTNGDAHEFLVRAVSAAGAGPGGVPGRHSPGGRPHQQRPGVRRRYRHPQRGREHGGQHQHRLGGDGDRRRRRHPDLHPGRDRRGLLRHRLDQRPAPDQGRARPRGEEQLLGKGQGQRRHGQRHHRRHHQCHQRKRGGNGEPVPGAAEGRGPR